MASTTPSGTPSSREMKYDRQLRLWGATGQNRLEAAHIALFGASGTGCEILKNLVLPGVGKFTVIDDQRVAESDLGVNFFLDESCVGKSRAECTAALLEELNPDVKGGFINDSLSNLLSTKPGLFQPGTTPFSHIVVVSPFLTADILKLSPEIPTFLVHSVGFTAVLRIVAPTLCVVETHPDTVVDLRLLNPWPELSALVSERTDGLDTAEGNGGMSDHQHGHVPYVVLLFKYLGDWKASHGGRVPSNYKEKDALSAMIRDRMRTNVPGNSEENYKEAMKAVLKNVRAAEVSPDTKDVLQDPRCVNPTANSESFWIIAHAVREFRDRSDQGAGLLPLSGSLPDMKAESSTYIELQNVYRARARRDACLVLENTKAVLARLGRDPESITLDQVSLFAKHSNFVRRINYRPLWADYASPPDGQHKAAVIGALRGGEGEQSVVHDYIAMRAWQEYYSRKGKPPGVRDKDLAADLATVRACAEDYLASLGHVGGLGERTTAIIRELVRAGGGELHVIASLAGGIAAQEIAKIITQQYVPFNNTLVFDGIKSVSEMFEF